MLAAMNTPSFPTPNSSAPDPEQDDSLRARLCRFLPCPLLQEYGLPILIALAVTSIGMVLFYTGVGTVAPVASGSLARLTMYPIHPVFNPNADSDPNTPGPGMPGAPLDQDQVIVLGQVQVKNISKAPLDIFDLSAQLTLPQEQQSSSGASPTDIDRLFQGFPDLAPMRMQPLLRRQVIPPGQTAEGLVAFHYPITQQQWQQRRKFQITVSFDNGPSLVLHTP